MDASFQGDEIGLEHSAPMPNVPMPDELREDVEVARELGGPKVDPRMSPMAKVKRPFHLRSKFELGSDAWGDDRFWNQPGSNFEKRFRCRVLSMTQKKRPFACSLVSVFDCLCV